MRKVSIVIPTRNRGHLLRYALSSALRQTYAPLEIVVCDNCSSDDTREIVASQSSRNVVYVRSNKALSMPDNWEFALRHVSGEYITYLSDDSYLLRSAIEIAMREANASNVKVLAWKPFVYFAADWLEPARRNTVYTPAVTSETYLLKSAERLRRLWANEKNIHLAIPRSLNSLCHASVVEKILQVQGRFFLPPCPDFTSAASMLLNVPEYLLIDSPLFIEGITSSSIGASAVVNLGKSAQEFAREFEGGVDDVGFLGIPTVASCILRSTETVRAFYTNEPAGIDLRAWLCAITDDLARVEANGGEVTGYWKTLARHLAGQALSLRLSIAKQRVYSRLKWRMAKIVRSSGYLGHLEMRARKYIRKGTIIVRGDKAGFRDIEGCAHFLEHTQVSRRVSPIATPARSVG